MEETNTNFSMPVMPAYGGGYGNNGGFGFGGDWAWIILLLVLCGGWGNGFGGGYGGGAAVPFMMGAADGGFGLYPWLTTNQNVNGGFRDQMVHDSITSVGDKVTSGFGDVALGIAGVNQNLCQTGNGIVAAVTGAQNAIASQLYSNQLADLERSFAAQTASTQGMTALQAQLAQCCCDNRAATADVKYTIATEACNDRAAVSQGIQTILDKLCQLELDGYKRENDNLRGQLSEAKLAASQTAQNAFIANGFANEVDQLYNRLNSCPVPTTPVYGRTPIFTCGGNGAPGCGCGGNGFVN